MPSYSLSHLSDEVLSRELTQAAGGERTATATLLAHLAEFDARRLYLPAGFPSLYAYCVQELHLSEDAACLRIHAARLALRFPAIFPALATGRLTLSAVVRLASHLGEDNADELLAAAAHQSKAGIERLLAERFPRLDLPTQVVPLTAATPAGEPTVELSVPERIEPPAPRPKVTALSPRRYGLQVTVSQETHDKLRQAQALLGHQVPRGDVAEVLDRALDALIRQLEKSKFAATDRPRRPRRTSGSRHIPAHVKRAVWERDAGRCTFVGEAGQRCLANWRLEYDHLDPVARGGETSVVNLRLRCRAHNQYEAERTFGIEFMRGKREMAQDRQGRRVAVTPPPPAPPARPAMPPHVAEVIPCLRVLGYKAGEARAAAALCEAMPEASIEDRVRSALRYFTLRGTSIRPTAPAMT